MTNELLVGAAFLLGSIVGAAYIYLQMKEIMQTKEEIKDSTINRLEQEIKALKENQMPEPDPYIPTVDEFMKISAQAIIKDRISKNQKEQEVNYGEF
jgi:hypothetical protein